MNLRCKVCGEKAAGFHFGAFTCEGCKVRLAYFELKKSSEENYHEILLKYIGDILRPRELTVNLSGISFLLLAISVGTSNVSKVKIIY